MSIRTRVDKLEAANGNAAPIVIWMEPGTSEQQALDKWNAGRGRDLKLEDNLMFVTWRAAQ